MKRTARTVGITAVCFMLAAVFCASVSADAETPQFKGSIAVEPHAKQMLNLARVTLLEAFAATGTQPQAGQAVEAELGVENGFLVYGFDFLAASGTKTKAFVDAGNGKLLVTFSEEEDNDSLQVEEGDAEDAGGKGDHQDKPDLTVAEATKAKVSLNDAVKTALAAAPGKAVAVKLSFEKDVLAYEVTVVGTSGKLAGIAVDATSGRIVTTEEENENGGEKETGEEEGND